MAGSDSAISVIPLWREAQESDADAFNAILFSPLVKKSNTR